MAMGYEGLVEMTVDGTNSDMALGTGASVPRNIPEIESSSAYGGQIKSPINQIGIGSPHVHDWEIHDGSIDVELTLDFYNRQVKEWIFDRQKDASIYISSRNGNDQNYNDCFWNSISISAQEMGAITSSIGFVALERSSYAIGGDYISNKTGGNILCTPPPASHIVPSPLNPTSDKNLIPIPYWNSKVEFDGSSVELVNWSVEFSQEVVKFFSCENNLNPVEPRFIAVGPMTANFSGDYIFVEAPSFFIPPTLTTLDINLGGLAGGELKFKNLHLESSTDSLQSNESLASISFQYKAFELEL